MFQRVLNKFRSRPSQGAAPCVTPAEDEAFFKERYPDFSEFAIELYLDVRNHTMTGIIKIKCAVRSADYVVRNSIEGAVVECGVWKGGTVMALLKAFAHSLDLTREFFLYDTFEAGMTEAQEVDVTYDNRTAGEVVSTWEKTHSYARLEEVQNYLRGSGYPIERIRFVAGDVLETIPKIAPERIAILRLDTDWYQTTRHELIHLFQRVVRGGGVIIDDYGHWQGMKQAVDEYLESNSIRAFLHRIDYPGRVFVKE